MADDANDYRTRPDPDKARRAVANPARPGEIQAGENCRAAPGLWAPEVDFGRCEGKGECADVCPFNIFEIRRIDAADYAPLPWLAKLKLLAHGRQVAYTPLADACRACGLCAVACPEEAIVLVRRAG